MSHLNNFPFFDNMGDVDYSLSYYDAGDALYYEGDETMLHFLV